ncbi:MULTISPECIES: amidohydrolase [Adlercreutzia]|uniref:Amidohydrolase family protein n=1 Tax=Adlercreutzia rubneri TaxID=2916441 RepID=A0A7K1T7L2_9ACTN|nr:amidohydrolase [Adlercreutzia rubneri]MCB6761536.1 amidohydrolase [Adlercreutzia equolifaciens]MCB6977267.1 amidohydrolase [Adlercreutzia equolifaciens]MDE8684580.1 amidohydrolase [Adlercreutzia rubneri]MVN59521.1 amidohydrolase family protein [Adlercreutzia rubneri]
MSMSRLDQLLSRRHFVIGSSALAAATLSGGLWGCASDEPLGSTGPSDSPEENAADLVLYNGHVQTMVSESEVASAIAIAGNKIVYVGDDSGIDAFVGDTTQVIDLDGKFVSPGFIDGHIHAPGNWFTKLYQIDLTGLSTNEEYLEAIRSFVEAHPDEEGYIGSPFMLNAYQLPDGSNPGPSKEDLDAICPDKPILIHDVSYHAAWVNSKAFEMAGVTADTPDPEGGLFYRNEKGEPSGCVSDAAKGIVFAIMPDTMTNDNLEQAMYKFMEEANSYGITGITNITQGGLDIIDMYHKVEREGNLTLRMRVVPTMKEGRTYDEVLSTIKSYNDSATDMISSNTVKIFYDGVTERGTAVFLEPYLESTGLGDHWCGEPIWSQEDFTRLVHDFDAEGVQVHVHAMGDGAVHGTLDAFEEARATNGERDARHTITHVCAITDEDIQRMADLDVVANLQFLMMYHDDLMDLERAYVGDERAMAMYRTKHMAEAGICISGSSDAPVIPFVPLDAIEAGVTRNSPYPEEEDTDMTRWPEQGLTAYQLLEAYTKNDAYQNFMDDIIGTVEVGKFADLVVLDTNILEADAKAISDARVIYTISDGRIVYEG